MSESADVLVIGGGIMGSSMALHLKGAGIENVRIVERDQTFQGTSAAGAGFVALWAMEDPGLGEPEVAVERYGLNFYRDLHEAGCDIGYAQNGFLAVAADDEGWREIEPLLHLAGDTENLVVDASRIEELTGGVIPADAVFQGVFQPSAAQVLASKLGQALTARLGHSGVAVDERRPVQNLVVRGGRVVGVETAAGTVEADAVVVATGAWTNELLKPLDMYLPIVPQVTSRIITEPLGIPSTLPLLFLMGKRLEPGGEYLWVRGHEGGLLWGGTYKTHPRGLFVDAPLPTRFDEVPIDGVLECQRLASEASRFMPVFSRYRSLTLKHGAPCYTPDHRALLGPVPGIEGLYVMAGDCEMGITHGPGFGKALADQIVDGSSALADIGAWRVDRFDRVYTSGTEVAEAIEARQLELARSRAGMALA